jgi:hypothetical protein
VIGGCNCDVIYILNGTEIMKLREADWSTCQSHKAHNAMNYHRYAIKG